MLFIRTCFIALALASFSGLLAGGPARAAEPAALTIYAPQPYQVVQRTGYDPVAAAEEVPGGAALGFADVAVRADFARGTTRETWEYRVVPLPGGPGREVGWTKFDV